MEHAGPETCSEGDQDVAARALKRRLQEAALTLGFVRCGVARAEPLGQEAKRLRAWLAAGHHGELDYMERTAEVRSDPGDARMLSGARSVVVLVTPYGTAPASEHGLGRVARYARGRDYHNVLHKRLRKLSRLLREAGHAVRAAVDSMPVFERAWAERAGVGFVGKNCCLIVPGIGSHVFLSALVTTADLPPDPPSMARCGTCTACLDACPTAAFVAPQRLDARRCISYWTIEQRGESPEDLRNDFGDWLFGCDGCQDVCPFNRARGAAAGDGAFAPNGLAQEPPEYFLAVSEQEFASRSQGTALRRAGHAGMARNAALLLGNRGQRRHLPLLQRAAAHGADVVVRSTAAWAVRRLERRLAATAPESGSPPAE